MAVIDPISDMLARIRNAHGSFHKTVSVPASKMKAAIAVILKDQGFISDFEVQGASMDLTLKYANGRPIIAGLKKVSTPGRRVYVGVHEIPRVQNGLGICILSTSTGVMEGEQARTTGAGGELLCEIW